MAIRLRRNGRQPCAQRTYLPRVESLETRHLLAADLPNLANSAPNGTDITAPTYDAGQGSVFFTYQFGFRDQADVLPDRLLAVKFTTVPSRGLLTNGGVPVAEGDVVSAADIAAQKLRYAKPTDGGPAYVSLMFQVQDDGGTANGSVDLDPTPNVMNITFSDNYGNPVAPLDVNGDTLVTSDDEILVLNMLNAFGPGPASRYPRYFDINLDGVFDARDYAIIDEHFLPSEDPPEGKDGAVEVLQGEAYTFAIEDFGFTDPLDSPPDNFVAVRIVALPPVGSLRASGIPVVSGQTIATSEIAAGKFVYVPPRDASGAVGSFEFHVRDDGSATSSGRNTSYDPYSIALNVIAVNDPPTFVMETMVEVTDESGAVLLPNFVRHVAPGPSDEEQQLLQFKLDVDDKSLFESLPRIDASGKLTFRPALNASGETIVRVALRDDGGTANGGVDETRLDFMIRVAKFRPLYNAVMPRDVDGDGSVAPRDVLNIINYINAHPRAGTAEPKASPIQYLDVNGDGVIAPGDALEVINYINAYASHLWEAEGESQRHPVASPPTDVDCVLDDVLTLLALDSSAPSGRRRR